MTTSDPAEPTREQLRDAPRAAHEAEKKHKPDEGKKGKRGR